tara:strand:- start:59 stop:643 length:585 start_codon:yes stop_codon:yes gene_type:complete
MAEKGGFWGGTANALVDPKRSFRWIIRFGDNTKTGIQEWFAKSASKPAFEVGETEHAFLNHQFYYPGKVKWQEMEVTLVDPSYPNDASQSLMKMLNQAGYYAPTDINSASHTITKKAAVAAIGSTVFLKQIGTDQNDVLETWSLVNPWLKNVNFGALSYENEDMVEITLTIRFDYAKLQVKKQKNAVPGPVPQS